MTRLTGTGIRLTRFRWLSTLLLITLLSTIAMPTATITSTTTNVYAEECCCWPKVSFDSASQSEPEDCGSMSLTAVLDKTSALDVTVPFTVDASSTATDGVDYSISTTTPGQVTIVAGNLTSDTITINVVDDALVEPDETVIINMGTPTNANKGTPDSHTATIEDNEPKVSFDSASQSEPEDCGSMSLTAVLDKTSALDVTV
ncbi:MAG TPA: hypothetical protein G4O09_09285, partial [Dehalococcoidia bacterium]|nr:hypothetical protein [Dehalococcoidia bacterium]